MTLQQPALRHAAWVRVAHGINALAFIGLVISGIGIFFAHPEFYWGETGYYGDETALSFGLEMNLEYARGGRNYHFLCAWLFVVNGLVYLALGALRRHFSRRMLPTRAQLEVRHVRAELRDHALLRVTADGNGQYNLLQKLAYLAVIFVLCPLMLLTGLTMSPSVTAALPELFSLFGGRQSARTIHFIVANCLVLFLLVHVAQVFITGVVKGVRSMVTGRAP